MAGFLILYVTVSVLCSSESVPTATLLLNTKMPSVAERFDFARSVTERPSPHPLFVLPPIPTLAERYYFARSAAATQAPPLPLTPLPPTHFQDVFRPSLEVFTTPYDDDDEPPPLMEPNEPWPSPALPPRVLESLRVSLSLNQFFSPPNNDS